MLNGGAGLAERRRVTSPPAFPSTPQPETGISNTQSVPYFRSRPPRLLPWNARTYQLHPDPLRYVHRPPLPTRRPRFPTPLPSGRTRHHARPISRCSHCPPHAFPCCGNERHTHTHAHAPLAPTRASLAHMDARPLPHTRALSSGPDHRHAPCAALALTGSLGCTTHTPLKHSYNPPLLLLLARPRRPDPPTHPPPVRTYTHIHTAWLRSFRRPRCNSPSPHCPMRSATSQFPFSSLTSS